MKTSRTPPRRRPGAERAKIDLLLTLTVVLVAFVAAEWLDLYGLLSRLAIGHDGGQVGALVTLAATLAVGMTVFAARRWRDAAEAAARRARAIHELNASEQRFTAAFRTSPYPQLLVSLREGVVLAANEAFLELTEALPSQVLNLPLRDLPLWQASEVFTRLPALVRRNGSIRNVEATLRNGRGEPRVVQLSAALVEMDGHRCMLVGMNDISGQKEAERQLNHLAFHDSLTGLPNRALFHDRVEHALVRGARSQTPPTVFLLDLDGFKWINDSFGHPVGDELLRQVAARLSGCLRESDTCARLGGDEFAVLIEDAGEHRGVVRVAERILEALGARFALPGIETASSASIGIARAEAGMDVDALLRNADLAMYMAKGAGKGRFELYDASMHRAAMARTELENDMLGALERGEFVLHYQPITSFAPRGTVALEALLRWAHPTRGMLGPDKFIPMAEENGTILALGRWALRTACAQCVEWQNAFPRPVPLAVSVNLSGRQIADPGFPDDVRQVLKETGLAPGSLILEINEGVLVHSAAGGTPRMWKLKAQGVRIAIDDFGTGYSSLAYLQRFPADILKVDRAFTEQLKFGEAASPLSTAVFALGQTLALQTVAEGVETEAQWARLKELGCELGQGYLISPPLDVTGATALLLSETAPALPMRMPPVPQWRHRRRGVEAMAGVHFA